jgi:hypothetical protein
MQASHANLTDAIPVSSRSRIIHQELLDQDFDPRLVNLVDTMQKSKQLRDGGKEHSAPK